MFFVISKVLAFLLQPLNWMALLALFSLYTKNTRYRKRSIAALIGVLLVFSNPWLVNQLARAWETGGQSPESITRPYETGILLGGFINFDAETPAGMLTTHQAGNRLTAALQLYESGKIRHILITGGAGRLIGDTPAEALVARDWLRSCQVPDSAIWVEDRSRNTQENAAFSRLLIDSLAPGSRCLLITSAFHMRRAEGCFEHAGIHCDPYAADFMADKNSGNLFHWLEPDWKALMKWELLIKEWIGYLVYSMKGYI